MPTEKKEKAVASLKEVFAKTNIGIMTDYRGLKTPELNELRRKLREANVEYKVVKNSLAQIAAKNAGLEYLEGNFKGPMAVAFGQGDIVKAAKTLTDYIRTSKSTLKITGGFLDNKVLTTKDLESLAKLPSREILLGRVIGAVQGPMYGLVIVLSASMRSLAQVLQARVNQMEAK